MATVAVHGRFASIRASSSSTATTSQTQLAELRDYTLRVTEDMNDVTSHDSSAWAEFLPGTRQWEGEADVVYISTGAGQAALRGAMTSATPHLFNFTFKQTTSNTTKKYQGKGYLMEFDVSGPTNDGVFGRLRIRGHGALTRTA